MKLYYYYSKLTKTFNVLDNRYIIIGAYKCADVLLMDYPDAEFCH